MELAPRPRRKITLERKVTYSLDEMLAQCDFDAPPPTELGLWDSAKPVGQEIW
ncbi:MAG: hypothetical protein ORN98_08595 [Alphaproteobacteria bacterium]|nr:hypothetical protein [Alphaproteobacteria bacterium]